MDIELIIQIITSIVAIAGIWLAYLQLRKMSNSLKIGHKGNLINVVSHCANRYSRLVDSFPREEEVKKMYPDKSYNDVLDLWYRSYCDLITDEFVFFVKQALDPDIFELWMSKLVGEYQSESEGLTFAQRHKNYLKENFYSYDTVRDFFDKIDRISQDSSMSSRARMLKKLVNDFHRQKISQYDFREYYC